jgi:excinuclease UvrABC nuclease subunit
MISDKLKDIPKNPGCYLFKNDKEQIIYVGMSKFLPKSVSSYFQKNHTGKTKTLVENIVDVEFKITSSEQEAILSFNDFFRQGKNRCRQVAANSSGRGRISRQLRRNCIDVRFAFKEF